MLKWHTIIQTRSDTPTCSTHRNSCTHTQIYKHVCTYTYKHTIIHTHLHTSEQVCTPTHLCAHKPSHICAYMYTLFLCVHGDTDTQLMNTHAYIHLVALKQMHIFKHM